MRIIYNIDSPEIVLHTSRQVAKCLRDSSQIYLATGEKKYIKDLKAGDELLSLDEETQKIVVNKIKDVEDNGKKPIYTIKTRTGRIAEVTAEHPFWTLNPKWTEARDLKVGDLIGLSRNNSSALPIEKTVPDHEYIILAHLLAEGGLSTKSIKYTNIEKDNSDELNCNIQSFNDTLELREYNIIGQFAVCFKYGVEHEHLNPLKQWLIDLKLMGKKSDIKFHPPLIFKLTKEQLQDYIRIWWNTDGYVSIKGRASLPDIGIALISKELIDGLQELLLRLGIHTTKSIQNPKIYEGTDKQVYKLRVEGADSVERFYELISTRKLKPYNKKEQNNNRLVIPKKALQPYFKKLKKQQYGNLRNSRHDHGWTQWSLGYDLTYSKLRELKENLHDDYLKTIYDADIIYDRIVEIGISIPESTTSIEMEYPHNTFLIDNLVTHNSTTLANLAVSKMCIMPQVRPEFSGGFRTLYIAPTVEQVKVFSHDRVSPVIEQSPIIKRHYVNSSQIQNVFHKRFINGSSMYFRYAAASADKARGLSVDQIFADEIQDIPDDNISVIQQAMSRSLYKRTLYAGTPKRTIGTLASRWTASTQNEWFVLCAHCQYWNYLTENNIQPWGLGCNKCHQSLDARNGQWVRTNPKSHVSEKTGQYIFEGFRISVLMFAHSPWVDWQKDVVIPFQQKPRGLFLNEYIGLPYDAGVQPITEREIRACCTGGPMRHGPDSYTGSYPTFMGMDWGPINSENSKTVESIIQKKGNMTEVLYLKKYEGKESDYAYIHRTIPAEFARWNCMLIGADAGFGESVNSEIRRRLANSTRLIALLHQGNQKQMMSWNQKINAYTLSRNRMMTWLFNKIKNRQIIFPQWEDFQPFAKDILGIMIDYDEEKGKYRFINSAPDDTFHSILYGDIIAELYMRTISPEPIGN